MVSDWLALRCRQCPGTEPVLYREPAVRAAAIDHRRSALRPSGKGHAFARIMCSRLADSGILGDKFAFNQVKLRKAILRGAAS